MEKVIAYYDDYMTEDLKQAIALKLLEEIPNFPLEEAEKVVKGEENSCESL